jgi:hypothetical protein
MSRRSIPEIRARLAQQEMFLRSLTKPARAGKASIPNKETQHEQDLVHHWSFPWHWRGDRQSGLGGR